MEKKAEAFPALAAGTPCEVCGNAPHKYRCPSCSIRTCSLACCNRHKEDTQCDGKRQRTAYVAIKKFGDRELQLLP